MAQKEDVFLVRMSIQDAIEQYEARNLGEMPDMSLDGELPGWDKDWTEGIEEFKNISTDVLWAMLGRPDKDLPWFNTHHDPDGIHNRWESRDDEWFANPKNLVPLVPRWHQLVGILRMLQLAFAGKPILLMDEVGVGKTLQVVGTITMLAYFRGFWKDKKDYPGAFGKRHLFSFVSSLRHSFFLAGRKFPSPTGEILSLPSLIVCPPSLEEQWWSELHKYIQPQTFDMFPCEGSIARRPDFWAITFGKTVSDHGHQIILATHSVSSSF